MTESLLPPGVAIDLSNCEREPIHIPGHVQAHGVLLALQPTTLEILQASANTVAFLGREVASLLGRPISEMLAADALALLQAAGHDPNLEDNPLHLFTGPVAGHGPFDAVVHSRQGLLVLELEPSIGRAAGRPDMYEILKRGVARFQAAKSVNDFCQLVTDEVRRVAGYDRVMIYRFADDWSGHVIAESMAPGLGLESYLDLHYPASDIPAQARALFLRNTVRMLPDTAYAPALMVPQENPLTLQPLDMSCTFLRGASRMYTDYLINMGVRASLTLAISQGDRLWGLVACHHMSPRAVPYEVRSACEVLSQVVSLQIGDKKLHDQSAYRERIEATQRSLTARLVSGGPLSDALTRGAPNLADLIDCGGAALVEGGACHLVGQTPPESTVLKLASWLGLKGLDAPFATHALPSLLETKDASGTAVGLLAVPLSRTGNDWLLWFRPEHAHVVHWGGDPNKPVEVLSDRLTPRRSFALWQQEVRGLSKPWTELEVAGVSHLRVAILEFVLHRSGEIERLNADLARSNTELDSFAFVASHDLKEPLRGIFNYAHFILEDSDATLDAEGRARLQTIVRLSKRMQELIDSLLLFSRLGKTVLEKSSIDLDELVTETIELVLPRARESEPLISIPRRLPRVLADRSSLIEVFTNLISNALKYNDKVDKRVAVGFWQTGEPGFPLEAEGAARCFFVEDNGIGIAEDHHEEVFRIFKRLHAQGEFGGGTGAGLTIVKKIVERHGGRVGLRSREREGSTFWFTLGEEKP